MDDNMTIAEMIDTYANFTNTREYYNLYKEAVSLDLKSLYVLTESYMQESSVESILEGSGIWDSIVENAIKFWEWIKRIFRKLINHISRFFHKIFSFTDQWYKAERAYLNGVNKVYSIATTKASNARSGDKADDMINKAAYAVARDLKFYNSNTAYTNGIEQEMDGADLKQGIKDALKELATGKAPKSTDFSDNNNVEDMNRSKAMYAPIKKDANGNWTIDTSAKNGGITDKLPQFYHVGGDNNFGKFFKGLAFYAGGREQGIGVFIPGKKADPLCKKLRADRDIRDGKTFADLLNITYLLTKPPLTVQVHEMFPTLLKLVEEFNNIVPKYIEGNGVNASILNKWSTKVTNATKSEKTSYTDIVIDQRFDTKLDKISQEFNINLAKIDLKGFGKTGSINVDNINADIKYEIDDRDREKALSGMSNSEGYTRIGTSQQIEALSSGARTEFVKAAGTITNMFSKISLGIMMIAQGMKNISEFRGAYIDAVARVLSNSKGQVATP